MDILRFNFQGGLSDSHRMDFYEAARFQYAAARLTVKLDQYRRTGRFAKRVTAASRTDIDLFAFERGSFNMRVAANEGDEKPLHVDVPLTALWTYIIERVFQPTDTPAALDLIDDTALRSEFFSLIDDNIFNSNEAINLLRSQIDTSKGLGPREHELLDRLISEVGRRSYLASHRDILAQISPSEDAALVTMATPLLSEIAVPLRRSAKLITISTLDRFGERPILTADRETASALETIQIDKSVTTIDVDIVQYNKETGWGKFRNPYWNGIPSFSIPADRKDELRQQLLSAMKEQQVSVDAYFVRSLSGDPIRLIIVDISAIDEDRMF